MVFLNMLHVSCVVHALHCVRDVVREAYPEVNEVVSSIQKIFSKAPSRVMVWRETSENISLPPEPILTRWAGWIEAALVHAQNFDKINEALWKLDAEDAVSIRRIECPGYHEEQRSEEGPDLHFETFVLLTEPIEVNGNGRSTIGGLHQHAGRGRIETEEPSRREGGERCCRSSAAF